MYKPLTPEQFAAAQKAGFSTDQIIANEKQRKAKEDGQNPLSNPSPALQREISMQGGNPFSSFGSSGNANSTPASTDFSFLQGADSVASGLGVKKFGQGLATTGRVASGSINQTGDEESRMIRDQQLVINKLQELRAQGVPQDDLRVQQLKTFLARNQGNAAVTQAQIDPGTTLSNKEVLGSAANVALLATSGGELKAGNFAKPLLEGGGLAGKVVRGAATGYAADVANAANNNQDTITKPGFGTGVGAALPIVTDIAGALMKRFGGFQSGAGTTVVQRAVDNPDEVNAAISKYAKTPELKQQLVDHVDSRLNDLIAQRNQAYGDALSKLSDTPELLKVQELGQHINVLNEKWVQNPTAANKKALDMAVKTYHQLSATAGISKDVAINSFLERIGSSGFGGSVDDAGNLVFKNSKLTPSDRQALSQTWQTLKDWTDGTPQGLDNLRQAIAGHMDEFRFAGNSRANVILGGVKKDLTNHLSDKLTGYGQALAEYADKTETLRALQADITTRSNSPTSQLNKVMRIFKKDPSVTKLFIEQLGEKEANKFLNEVSGAILSDWVNPSLKSGFKAAGDLAAGAGALMLGHPVAAAAAGGGLAATSPRITGKLATTAGKLKGTGRLIRKAATFLSSKLN